MLAATFPESIVSLADLREAAKTLARDSAEMLEAKRCAHTLIDSVTAIMIATDAAQRWLANAQSGPEEFRRMTSLIDFERTRAATTATRFRTLT